MLVLSRYADESILIGDDIVVTICRIDGDKITLGIEAPRDTLILRSELVGKPRRTIEAGAVPIEIENLLDAADAMAHVDAENIAIVHRRMAEDIPLDQIERELDARENQRKGT